MCIEVYLRILLTHSAYCVAARHAQEFKHGRSPLQDSLACCVRLASMTSSAFYEASGPDANTFYTQNLTASSAGIQNAADAASPPPALPQAAGGRAIWQDHTGDG
jgi:hypothetical protein